MMCDESFSPSLDKEGAGGVVETSPLGTFQPSLNPLLIQGGEAVYHRYFRGRDRWEKEEIAETHFFRRSPHISAASALKKDRLRRLE